MAYDENNDKKENELEKINSIEEVDPNLKKNLNEDNGKSSESLNNVEDEECYKTYRRENKKEYFHEDREDIMELRSPANNGKFIKNAVMIVALTAMIALGCAGYYFYDSVTLVKSWENKVYPGVSIMDVDLSGKLKEESIKILENEAAEKFYNKQITINAGDMNFALNYSDINVELDIEAAVNEAIKYGKNETMFEKKALINKPVNKKIQLLPTYDEKSIEEFANEVESKTLVEAKNATLTIDNGNISIIPEVNGMRIDKEELVGMIKNNISTQLGESSIVVTLKEFSPKITEESLKKIDSVIASFSGPYVNTGNGRVENMRLATEYVNGILLMPGDEFSYNLAIGETTPERGYQIANTYVGDKIVPDYGGGVCQVSTYLYRGVMRAGLKPSIRYCHNMMVSYAQPSMDATVFEGDIDYRFINTYDFPIYVSGSMGDGQITFTLYGNKEGMKNRTYELTNEILEEYPHSTVYNEDPTQPVGYENVVVNGCNGYSSQGYLITYENGVEVSSELISTDYYAPMDTIVTRGSKVSQ